MRILLENFIKEQENNYIKIESIDSKINIQKLKIKKYNGQYLNLILPLDNYTKYFQPSIFLKNYFWAFKNEFPSKANLFSFPEIEIEFQKENLDQNLPTNLNEITKPYFKILTCLIFGFLFDIKLGNDCICYPYRENNNYII